jgi:hypothetical protein
MITEGGGVLTDIFADRYDGIAFFPVVGAAEQKLLVQGFRIIAEQLFPYYDTEGKARPDNKAVYELINRRLSMELGLTDISPRFYSYQQTFNGQVTTLSGTYTPMDMAKNFVCGQFHDVSPFDRFIKERLSYVELAFRHKGEEVANWVADLPKRLNAAVVMPRRNFVVPGDPAAAERASTQRVADAFAANVAELNERLLRANTKLQYHNGFIQPFGDSVVAAQIEEPFWTLVAAPLWKNVDTDMKEAVERRDALDRDPGFYAFRSLESVVKIISDEKGWTTGSERGAASYVDNLGSKANAFIDSWERESLVKLFGVRNMLGHGPGKQPMPTLTLPQTNWVIDSTMAWVRSLVTRI